MLQLVCYQQWENHNELNKKNRRKDDRQLSHDLHAKSNNTRSRNLIHKCCKYHVTRTNLAGTCHFFRCIFSPAFAALHIFHTASIMHSGSHMLEAPECNWMILFSKCCKILMQATHFTLKHVAFLQCKWQILSGSDMIQKTHESFEGPICCKYHVSCRS